MADSCREVDLCFWWLECMFAQVEPTFLSFEVMNGERMTEKSRLAYYKQQHT